MKLKNIGVIEMTDNFDPEPFILNYIKNIRVMQQLTDAQIREVMLRKIEDNPDYFEIISDVSQKVDNKKLIRQVLADHNKAQGIIPEPDKFTGRNVA